MWLTKYSASGNDFLITMAFKKQNHAKLAKELCNRFNGIGADGFVILLPHDRLAYQWDFYNSDGSKANMCGNASRCVAHYAYYNKLAKKSHSFLSGAGIIEAQVSKDIVEINLGEVKILQKNIIEKDNFTLLDSGVRHLVAFRNSLEVDKVYLKAMREKYNANVNIARILDNNNIELLTYERGVEDITLACGTGMGATYYLAKKNNMIGNKATLIPPSKEKLELRTKDSKVYFKGAVKKIAEIFI